MKLVQICVGHITSDGGTRETFEHAGFVICVVNQVALRYFLLEVGFPVETLGFNVSNPFGKTRVDQNQIAWEILIVFYAHERANQNVLRIALLECVLASSAGAGFSHIFFLVAAIPGSVLNNVFDHADYHHKK